MQPNVSGFSKVSQLLSEAERTLPFDGVVTATQLSDSYAGNFKPDVPVSCGATKKGRFLSETKTLAVPLSSLGPSQQFSTLQKFFETTQGKAPASVAASPEGTTHEALVSGEVLAGDARCGFDRNGTAKAAIFSSELDHYASFEQGKLMAQWDEFSDKFRNCKSD